MLASLALLALALGSAMFSGASFSSKSANNASLSAASVRLSSTAANQAIVSAEKMKPGESREGTIEIGNKGDVTGTVTLKASGLSGAALAAVIDLKIEDVSGGGSTQKWSGKLASLATLNLGSFTANETHSYKFTLSWPSASNEASLQGASTSLSFQWSIS